MDFLSTFTDRVGFPRRTHLWRQANWFRMQHVPLPNSVPRFETSAARLSLGGKGLPGEKDGGFVDRG